MASKKDMAECMLIEKMRRLSKDWTLEDIQRLNKEASRVWRKYHKIEDMTCLDSPCIKSANNSEDNS